ncbi:MAG: DUF4382 domain-containing protein [Deltaproteobacteria bacterium]|nr:DUF4382 domain-containing protein [Deltaproteobacteria bacterium]
MEHRRQISRIFPGLVVALLVASLAVLNGCGGSTEQGGGTSSNAVNVSLATAQSFPAGTTFASSTLSPATAAPPANSPVFDNVFVTVTKLALIPSTGTEFPDGNGELETPNSPTEEGKGFVTAVLTSPIVIDLLHLTGENAATLLNQFSGVPAGGYSKIRVYYDNVVGHSNSDGDTLFHPTAHYHFDVHFVGGNLVIPVTTDPQGGIRFFSVVINVVGLKYHQAGQSGNVLLRPQVFATVDNTSLKYIVTGVADNVTNAGTFDILTPGGRSIPAAFSDTGTTWAYSDDVLNNSLMVHSRDKNIASLAFKDRAGVSAIGVFDTGRRLQASHITFTFPDVRIGKVFSTWSADNTFFRINLPLDNLVYTLPDKTNPLYTDFRVPPLELLNGYNLIVPNPDNTVKARGYDFTGSQGAGLQAFWISIDNNIGP